MPKENLCKTFRKPEELLVSSTVQDYRKSDCLKGNIGTNGWLKTLFRLQTFGFFNVFFSFLCTSLWS